MKKVSALVVLFITISTMVAYATPTETMNQIGSKHKVKKVSAKAFFNSSKNYEGKQIIERGMAAYAMDQIRAGNLSGSYTLWNLTVTWTSDNTKMTNSNIEVK